MIKQHLEQLISSALNHLKTSQLITILPPLIQVDVTKDKQHGDFATNVALVLAKLNKKNPRELAAQIISNFSPSIYVEKVELAGPGFINFFLTPLVLNEVVRKILNEKENYGASTMGREKSVLVEFVSSNPTGPLHVGHGRHAILGDVICRLLNTIGFKSYREYYVNDDGRQMDILALSVWLRYLLLCGEEFSFPEKIYQGEYVIDIAKEIYHLQGDKYYFSQEKIFADCPRLVDEERYIDALIERAKLLLGEEYYLFIFDHALTSILADIKADLSDFGVQFDRWFSERELVKSGIVTRLLETWREQNYLYEKEGAIWFAATLFGDEKDRVLVRSNGQKTYFINDVVYHLSKFERQFDLAIDIFGSDHHGYVPRMKAAMLASNNNPERLLYLLVQFVTLYRGGEQVQMSTRGGNFVTLRELREEVGNDAARFFYVMRKHEQHIDFDLDLAKSKSNDNPVYYVQYAYARICSIFKQAHERGIQYDEENALKQVILLTETHERVLLQVLSLYPETITQAALNYEPHQLTHYLRGLAMAFHTYYNATPILIEEKNLRDARLALITAVQYTLRNGFNILGISAPESM